MRRSPMRRRTKCSVMLRKSAACSTVYGSPVVVAGVAERRGELSAIVMVVSSR